MASLVRHRNGEPCPETSVHLRLQGRVLGLQRLSRIAIDPQRGASAQRRLDQGALEWVACLLVPAWDVNAPGGDVRVLSLVVARRGDGEAVGGHPGPDLVEDRFQNTR